MDGIQLLQHREAAFPDEAKTILYTTRNPIFHKDNIRLRQKVRLSAMDKEDTAKLVESIRSYEGDDYDKRADLYDRATLMQIVDVVQGHPLAALNAIKYIIRSVSVSDPATAGRNFVAMMRSNDYENRLRFLEYCPDSPSIMETFKVSLDRLAKPNGPALAVINFLGFLETEGEDDFDLRDFFFKHSCPVPAEDFPDYKVLFSGSFLLQELFSELEKVSFGERLNASKPFQFHPLWLECTRHYMGPEGRIRYARQVLLVCYYKINIAQGNIDIPSHSNDSYVPHVRKCLQVCKSFKIGLDDLKLPGKISKVFRDIDNIV